MQFAMELVHQGAVPGTNARWWQCDLLDFKRRSFVLQIGITSDSIFCMKISKIKIFQLMILFEDKIPHGSYNVKNLVIIFLMIPR